MSQNYDYYFSPKQSRGGGGGDTFVSIHALDLCFEILKTHKISRQIHDNDKAKG